MELPPRKRTTRKNSWSQTPNSVLERRASGPHYFPKIGGAGEENVSRDRSHSLEQPGNSSLLSTVLPLDWPFTDSEPDPPSSPKQVGQSSSSAIPFSTGAKLKQQQSASSSQGSSGTDTETKTLLGGGTKAKAEEAANKTGAIPKKHLAQNKQPETLEDDQVDNGSEVSSTRHPLSAPTGDPSGAEFKTSNTTGSSGAWRKRAFRRRPTADREEEILGQSAGGGSSGVSGASAVGTNPPAEIEASELRLGHKNENIKI